MFRMDQMSQREVRAQEITIVEFHEVARLMKKFDDQTLKGLADINAVLRAEEDKLNTLFETVQSVNQSMLSEVQLATRRNPLDSIEEQTQDYERYRPAVEGKHFLRVVYEIMKCFLTCYSELVRITNDIIPGQLLLSDEAQERELGKAKSTQQLQDQMYEFQLNQGVVQRFVNGCIQMEAAAWNFNRVLNSLSEILDNYYQFLSDRHNNQGEKVFVDAVNTDVALTIWANIDAHGEIEAGKKPDEISAYSAGKAMVMLGALKEKFIAAILVDDAAYLGMIDRQFQLLSSFIGDLHKAVGPIVEEVVDILFIPMQQRHRLNMNSLGGTLQRLSELNPKSIIDKGDERFVSKDQRFNTRFRNETLSTIAEMNMDPNVPPAEILKYVLGRKAELKKHFQDENSFYVCKIGNGNPFMGVAPGALEVVPGVRPNTKLDHIRGSGFDEVRSFIKSVHSLEKWAELFMLTSPSGKVDKANCLLIGPQGCGKTEIMRAVAGEKDSIGIFAQASDFLTCWRGEAEKNPKRLFESGMKLRKESKKHVHFLIDEIDAILNNDRGHNDVNLTLEFQILMDGIVSYPGLSMWGATNAPERIPMPMIRRFSKVVIVGELTQQDRIDLLKHFVGFLPTKKFDDKKWGECARKLDGATGDVVRKVADHLWRTKVTWFVQHCGDKATEILDFIKQGEDESGFDVNDLDEKTRHAFKQKLGKHISVTPSDLMEAIDVHLKNVAIHAEIETAKETYERAKRFLAALDSGQQAQGNNLIIEASR